MFSAERELVIYGTVDGHVKKANFKSYFGEGKCDRTSAKKEIRVYDKAVGDR